MINFWKKKPALGVGLGVGVLGAVALAVRYALKHAPRPPIPENISPTRFATHVAQTVYGEVVYHSCGAGDPMVFLHGIYPGASSYEWSLMYPEFTTEYLVVAPDLLGFGESERPRPGLDADQHVQALADVFREVFPGRAAVLVASGFGAALAVKLAAQHPELVRSLVLLAPEGFETGSRRVPRGISTLARIPRLNGFLYRNSISRPPFVKAWLARFGFRNPESIGDEVVEVLTTCASQYGAEHAVLAFLRGRVRYDVTRQLPRVTQPTTLLWPEGDPAFPQDAADRIAGMIAFCRVTGSSRIGPLAALECPDVVLPMLRASLGPAPVSEIAA